MYHFSSETLPMNPERAITVSSVPEEYQYIEELSYGSYEFVKQGTFIQNGKRYDVMCFSLERPLEFFLERHGNTEENDLDIPSYLRQHTKKSQFDAPGNYQYEFYFDVSECLKDT